MARIYTNGYEAQVVTAGIEVLNSVGSPSISTAIKRSGAASLEISGAIGAGAGEDQSFDFAAKTALYARYAIYIDSMDSSPDMAAYFDTYSGATNVTSIQVVDSAGVLTATVYYNDFAASLANTFNLSYDTWHVIELYYDSTPANGSEILTVRLDGVEVASATNLTHTTKNITSIDWGVFNGTAGSLSGTKVHFDDIAVNDTTGSYANSWCGLGKLVMARPTGAGDNNPTAGNANSVNELPVTDTVTSSANRIELDTNTTIADFNMTDPSTLGIDPWDTIVLLDPIVRLREETAGTSSWQHRLKSRSGGTVQASGATDAGNATLRTNPTSTTAFTHRNTSYVDPVTGVAWIPEGKYSLKNFQQGIACLTTTDLFVAWMGTYIEYIENSAPPTNAIRLNGSSQYAKVDNFAGIDSLTDFTIETYIRRAPSSGAYNKILDVWDTVAADNVAGLSTENGAGNEGVNFNTVYSGANNADGYIADSVLYEDTWTHIALIHRATEKKTFIIVNGREMYFYNLQQTGDGSQVLSNTVELVLGRGGDTLDYIPADVGGFFRVWNRALEPGELYLNYNKLLTPASETGLVVNCNFSEGSGTVVDNDATSGEDLDLYGTPTWVPGLTLSTKTYTTSIFHGSPKASADDGEQNFSGTSVAINSSDLEIVNDGIDGQVAIRFPNVTIPQGSTIGLAYLRLIGKDVTSAGTVSPAIQADDVDNSAQITTGADDIGARTKTTASVTWTAIPATAAGVVQTSPDIKTVVQEITDRPGFTSGNALTLIISGSSGTRRFFSYDGQQYSGGQLYVEYTPPGGGASQVKKFIGITQANLKKIIGNTNATTKKIAGVANV